MFNLYTEDSEEVMEASVEGMVEILGVAEVPLAHQVVGVTAAGQLVSQRHVLALVTARVTQSLRNNITSAVND